ncbi:MAG TPA: S66 peptidase family protein [Treponemataceae bacterium]|nr:S66 peptidase family protein [Treponemataceae bacterium]
MKYPTFLKINDTIGLVAPSFGCNVDPYATRLTNAIQKLTQKGFTIKEGAAIRSYFKAASASAQERAKEFVDMYTDDSVHFVSSVGGGERMIEILSYINFDDLCTFPAKYFMGYSDNTILTFTLTTQCDVPSIYYVHTPDFGMHPWCDSINDGLKIIQGIKTKQNAYTMYELEEDKDTGKPLAPYVLKGTTKWHTFNNKDVSFTGCLIGGCLDVLQLLCGTPYGDISAFQKRYKKTGFIWYLETCDLHAIATLRALWQLKNNGFFTYVKGFLIGKPLKGDDFMDVTYQEAVISVLGDCNVPIVFDMNVGHISPTIPMLNGFIATVTHNKHESSIVFSKLL